MLFHFTFFDLPWYAKAILAGVVVAASAKRKVVDAGKAVGRAAKKAVGVKQD